ncbi:glycosyl transferase family 1 [Yersinia pseudotuberculosis]|uniref:Putative glycosyltransferase n=1 Tax=Yersinia pseudotuberculosis TaxID=633 RepID=A0A0M3MZN6_YERPU|nr:glycosyltransferase [Yersinia pseudotuberculosis]AKA20936.1 WbyO [Yersinia pseudotuberculosis]AKA20967.1 WbyO [Yersinia pseudotuberculosis]AKL88155.1 putative glycosyltransferase [Yersinia pseudotuberculosis]CNK90642.1 glycosyltransferase%2C MSMEG_0565 family [Yersinia pseudotuberculosis]
MNKKVLIFNFYNGVLSRGIPIYSNNLAVALSKNNIVKNFGCPIWLINKPRWMIDVLFVIYEQLLFPFYALIKGYDKVIYPYNSCSVLSSIFNNSLLIIHDFIPNKKTKKTLSSTYICLTQWIHARLNRDVGFVSETTYRLSKNISYFKGVNRFLLPNSFYLMMEKINKIDAIDSSPYILLVSGEGANKRFKEALSLYKSLPGRIPLKVAGFGKNTTQAENIISELNIDNVEVLPLLSDYELTANLVNSKMVWAHSIKEGFGRPVVEGRLCGKPVIASNIPAFKEHKDDEVYLYDIHNFSLAYELALNLSTKTIFKNKYHAVLEKELARWLS